MTTIRAEHEARYFSYFWKQLKRHFPLSGKVTLNKFSCKRAGIAAAGRFCRFCSIASYSLFDFSGPVFDARLASACSFDFYLPGRLAKSKVIAFRGDFVCLLDLLACLICLFA